MEDPVEDQSAPVSASLSKSKLRYPLRSAAKLKEEKTPAAKLSNSSASRRQRSASTVSKSISVLDLSGKDKSAKPPRRLSIPAKPTVNHVSKFAGNITPISEVREKRSTNGQPKSETPLSDVSRSASRKKFSVLCSSSYWLSQIKLSESASKHVISLGFFKLALEAGCEPLQRMRDELKSYVCRYNLSELGETLKELFDSYNLSENPEQLQVSETCSQVPEEGTRSSDDDVHSTSSTQRMRKLKPKSLNADTAQVSSTSDLAKRETFPKNNSAARTKRSLNKNTANSGFITEAGDYKLQKKSQKPTKQESNKDKDKSKKHGKKSGTGEGPIDPSSTENPAEENKENMDAPVEEISTTEVI